MQKILAGIAAALVAGGVHAQTYASIEDAARLTDQHDTRLLTDTVQRQSGMLRFDVNAGWKHPEQRPETEAPRRILRYLARCEQKELAIMNVAVYDTSLRIAKSFGIAPGGWDFAKPESGTAEARFLEKVCSMPL